MEKEPKIFVEHILGAIASIRTYTHGLKKSDFLKNAMRQDAVIRQLEIIGEASNSLTKNMLVAVPGVRWRDIADMRNKLIHEYFAVDLNVVWDTLRKDIPPFERAMKKLLKTLV